MSLVSCAELTIKVGDRLDHPVVDKTGQVLLQKGKIVASSAVVARLIERGYMRIGEDSEASGGQEEDEEAVAAEGPAAAAKTAQGKLAILAQQLNRVMRRIVECAQPGVDSEIRTLAGWSNGIFVRDQDQLLGVQQLIGADDSSIEGGAIHGAILVRFLAGALGMDSNTQLSLMSASLTRHVARVGDDPAPLDAEIGQRSASLLRQAGVEDSLWLDAVENHCARLDGTGIPANGPEGLSQGARLLGVVDHYLAITRRGEASSEAQRPRDALRSMFAGSAASLDSRMVQTLVKLLGIYPPGSVLKLANGEVAVSTRTTGDPKRPIVRAAIATDGLPYGSPPLRDIQTANSRIVEVLDAVKYKSLVSMAPTLWRRDLDLTEACANSA